MATVRGRVNRSHDTASDFVGTAGQARQGIVLLANGRKRPIDQEPPTGPTMTRAADPAVSVIIVNYNSGQDLARCLDGLEAQTFRDFEILVVDNQSTDGSLDIAQAQLSQTEIINAGGNLGFAKANNIAAERAKGVWLALLNPDAVAEPDWLAELMAATERYPSAAAFGSTQLSGADPSRLDGCGDPYFPPIGMPWRGGIGHAADEVTGDGEVFGICGAAAFYRRDIYLDAGGLADMFFCYYEDVDLSYRLRLMGHRLIQVEAARVRHTGSASAGVGSDFVYYHTTRNRLWLFLVNTPGPVLALLAPGFLAYLAFQLIRAPFEGKARPRWRAARDALAGLPREWQRRQNVQARRTATVYSILRAMTWCPTKLVRRSIDVRPVANQSPYRQPDSRVGVVVVSYNADDKLTAAIKAIVSQVERVWLIENGSDEAGRLLARSAVELLGGKLELIQNETNVGLAAAQNQGIRLALDAGMDWVMLHDDDSIAEPGMVAALLAAYNDYPQPDRIGLVSPALFGSTLSPKVWVSRLGWLAWRVRLIPGVVRDDALSVMASGTMIPAHILRSVGHMRGSFFIDYIDFDYALRLRLAGYRLLAIGDARMRHSLGEHTKSGVRTHPGFRRYYIYRNRIRVGLEYGLRVPAILMFEAISITIDLLKLVLVESDKASKATAIFSGVWDGLVGRTGPRIRS